MAFHLQKLNRLIKEELGKIIFKEIYFPKGILVTISQVDTSADGRHTTVKISVLPSSKAKKVLAILQKNIFFLQKLLDQKLVRRYVPKIRFKYDFSSEKASRVEYLLKEIKKEIV